MAIISQIGLAIVWLSGVWLLCLVLATQAWVQRHVFYLHKIPIWWGQRLNVPETFGYLRNQVTPLHIRTSDGEKLYAWLVTPLAVYAKYEEAFQKESNPLFTEIREKLAFQLLAEDPTARLVIYFHGNAGTVGQTRRTEAYRSISAGSSSTIHVLAFDYRGFGYSAGSPTEEGCITDAISVVKWAINEARVPPARIILLAQSLGTALACAAATRLLSDPQPIELGGLILCAAFPDAATAFQNYSIGGTLPLLAPLKAFPPLRKWFARRIKDSWKTSERLGALVRSSRRLRLTFVHAISDNVITWGLSDELFYEAVKATSEEGIMQEEVEEKKETVDLGEAGWINVWRPEDKVIRQEIVKFGGHNGIMKWAPVALAVLRTFETV